MVWGRGRWGLPSRLNPQSTLLRQASQTVGVNCASLLYYTYCACAHPFHPVASPLSPHPHHLFDNPHNPPYLANPFPFKVKILYPLAHTSFHDLSTPNPSSTPSDFIITISTRHLLSASFSLFLISSLLAPRSHLLNSFFLFPLFLPLLFLFFFFFSFTSAEKSLNFILAECEV